MSYRCQNCQKKMSAGRSHTHHTGVAGGQWKKRAQKTIRSFKPNLRSATIEVEGVTKKLRLCTKCIKRIRFDKNALRNKSSAAKS